MERSLEKLQGGLNKVLIVRNPTATKKNNKFCLTKANELSVFESFKFYCKATDLCFLIVLGLATRQPLLVILWSLPEKGRKEIDETEEEMKEMDSEERGTGMKVNKHKK